MVSLYITGAYFCILLQVWCKFYKFIYITGAVAVATGGETRFVLRKFGRFSGALENRVVFMGFHAPEKRPARPVFFGKNDPKAQESLGCGWFLLFFMIFHGVEAPAKLRKNVCFP